MASRRDGLTTDHIRDVIHLDVSTPSTPSSTATSILPHRPRAFLYFTLTSEQGRVARKQLPILGRSSVFGGRFYRVIKGSDMCEAGSSWTWRACAGEIGLSRQTERRRLDSDARPAHRIENRASTRPRSNWTKTESNMYKRLYINTCTERPTDDGACRGALNPKAHRPRLYKVAHPGRIYYRTGRAGGRTDRSTRR